MPRATDSGENSPTLPAIRLHSMGFTSFSLAKPGVSVSGGKTSETPTPARSAVVTPAAWMYIAPAGGS